MNVQTAEQLQKRPLGGAKINCFFGLLLNDSVAIVSGPIQMHYKRFTATHNRSTKRIYNSSMLPLTVMHHIINSKTCVVSLLLVNDYLQLLMCFSTKIDRCENSIRQFWVYIKRSSEIKNENCVDKSIYFN